MVETEKYGYGLDMLPYAKDKDARDKIIANALILLNKSNASLKSRMEQDQLASVIREEQNERERIAKNLHDELGINLNIARLDLLKKLNNCSESERELIESVIKLLDATIETVRTIAYDLVSPTLRMLGYFKALWELEQQINDTGEVTLKILTLENEIRFNSETEIQLYRITKELVNNIIKHSMAKEINLSVRCQEGKYTISISHNGKGITTEEAKKLANKGKCMGLKNIFNRAYVINAEVEYYVHDASAETVIVLDLNPHSVFNDRLFID